MKLRWFPPSWLQIRVAGKVIYIDPAYLSSYFTRYPTKIEFSKWPDPIDGLPDELEPAAAILITHSHKDHCKRVTVNRLRNDDTLVVAPRRCVKELGDGLRIVSPEDEITTDDFAVRVVDAYNTPEGASTKKVHKKGEGVGYLVASQGKTIYHAGDTDHIPEMGELADVDVALLPIGGTFTMDIDEAVAAAMAIVPRMVIPMHRAKADPDAFKSKLEAVSAIKVVPLGVGETIELL